MEVKVMNGDAPLKLSFPAFLERVMTPEEKKELAQLKEAIISLIRKIARKNGVIAKNLKDFGAAFSVIKHSRGYRKATDQKCNRVYHCPNGCDWVKEFPHEVASDEGGLYVCRICGGEIGKIPRLF
ncbi:hypothetical protein ACFL0A_01600 [Patescibacteria group bacterium]